VLTLCSFQQAAKAWGSRNVNVLFSQQAAKAHTNCVCLQAAIIDKLPGLKK
jgi:hypothetical protein